MEDVALRGNPHPVRKTREQVLHLNKKSPVKAYKGRMPGTCVPGIVMKKLFVSLLHWRRLNCTAVGCSAYVESILFKNGRRMRKS